MEYTERCKKIGDRSCEVPTSDKLDSVKWCVRPKGELSRKRFIGRFTLRSVDYRSMDRTEGGECRPRWLDTPGP